MTNDWEKEFDKEFRTYYHSGVRFWSGTTPKKVKQYIQTLLQKQRKDITKQLRIDLPDLVEEYFPKGECKERGQAIVLGATIIYSLRKGKKDE